MDVAGEDDDVPSPRTLRAAAERLAQYTSEQPDAGPPRRGQGFADIYSEVPCTCLPQPTTSQCHACGSALLLCIPYTKWARGVPFARRLPLPERALRFPSRAREGARRVLSPSLAGQGLAGLSQEGRGFGVSRAQQGGPAEGACQDLPDVALRQRLMLQQHLGQAVQMLLLLRLQGTAHASAPSRKERRAVMGISMRCRCSSSSVCQNKRCRTQHAHQHPCSKDRPCEPVPAVQRRTVRTGTRVADTQHAHRRDRACESGPTLPRQSMRTSTMQHDRWMGGMIPQRTRQC